MGIGLWIGIAGAVLGAFGIGYAIWARHNPKTDADIAYAVVCVPIAPMISTETDVPLLGLTYDGQAVPMLSSVRIAFRNFGPSRLNAGDEETKIAVQVSGKNGRIVDVRFEGSLDCAADRVELRLSPMHVGDIRELEILHSFDDVEPADVVVTGALRNVPNGLRRTTADPADRWMRSAFRAFLVVGALSGLSIGLIVGLGDDIQLGNESGREAALLAVASMSLLVLGAAALANSLRRGRELYGAPRNLGRLRARWSPFGRAVVDLPPWA